MRALLGLNNILTITSPNSTTTTFMVVSLVLMGKTELNVTSY